MKTVTRLFILFLLVALAGGAWWYFGQQGGPDTQQAAGGASGGAKPAGGPQLPPGGMPVEGAPVKVGAVSRFVQAVGTLVSSESVVIRPEVAGRVVAIEFQEGGQVKKGQVLFRLDDAVQRATLAEAEASLRFSRADYQRAQELTRQGASAQKNRDAAIAKLQADEAAVALAHAQLDKLTLVAPFDGDIGLRKVSVGDVVQPGAALVNLEAIDPLKVDFRVPELYLPAVSVGQTVQMSVDAIPGKSFPGQVYAIDPLVDVNGRSINIRARIPNPDRSLRPGLFARVSLTLTTRPDAILVPEQALVAFGKDQFVYKIVDGKATQAKVKLGERRNGEVEIVEGLVPTDVVVTAGQMKIRDGVPVNPVNLKPAT
ncbi:MAG TPA: efflux RND transporter periplasmic adaptor subunit [Azospirillaceae bacterium]|nr:efflux RND transporter periplasmic adaptor subunit [Azospirillaceae bacterium]